MMRFAIIALLLAAPASSLAGVESWTTTGPRTAWSRLAADAHPGGPVFLGTRGRFYRSVDEGRSWSPVAVTLDAAILEPQAFAFDAAKAGRVCAALGTFGIYCSDDAGARWVAAGQPFATVPIVPGGVGSRPRVVRLEIAAQTIHVLNNSFFPTTIQRSTDGGETWTSTATPLSGSVFDFALDPALPGAIYATGVGGVQRSADDGNRWATINDGLPNGSIGRAIAADPFVTGRVFVVAQHAPLSVAELFVSNDRGGQWTSTNVVFAASGAVDSQIVFDARAGSIVVRVGPQLARSADDGRSWQFVSPRDGARALGIAQQSGRLLTTALGYGFLVSEDGATWVTRNDGLPGAPTMRLGSAGVDPVISFAHSERAANAFVAFRRSEAANLWQPPMVGNPAQPLTAFGTSARGSGVVLASTFQPLGAPNVQSADGGATWQNLTATWALSTRTDSFVLSPRSDATVYAVGRLLPFASTGVYFGTLARSDDGGLTWRDVIPLLEHDVNSLAICAASPDVLYAGAGFWSAWRIVRSTDAGDTWSRITVPPDLDRGNLTVVVDPGNPQRIAAASEGSTAWWSADGGTSWTSIGKAPLPAIVKAIAVDWSSVPPRAFAGTTQGVFSAWLSADGGWSLVGDSQMLDINALQLERRFARVTLTAGTQAGVWEYTFDPERTLAPVYGFVNTATGTPFYTASDVERDLVLLHLPQFTFAGVAFFAAESALPGTTPVYRFYNSDTGAHFYTASAAERDAIRSFLPQFVYEDVRFHAVGGEPGTVKVFRAFDAAAGVHYYTARDDAHDAFLRSHPHAADEGVRFSVYPASSQ